MNIRSHQRELQTTRSLPQPKCRQTRSPSADTSNRCHIGVSTASRHRRARSPSSVLRIGVMVALAMLLILGILPAVLAVEAASN
jgi:hypothetical protein